MQTPLQAMAQLHVDRHPEEAARVLESLPPDEIAAVLQNASTDGAAGVLACLAPGLASLCLAHCPESERSEIVVLLPTSTAAALLRLLEPGVRDETLGALPEFDRVRLTRALSYPDQSAGAFADPTVVTLHADLTVEEALFRLSQSQGPVAGRIFVLNRSRRLLGFVTPGQLLTCRRDATLESLNLGPAHAVPDRVGAATLRAASAEPLAVVDSQGVFVGAIGSDVLAHLEPQRRHPAVAHFVAAAGEMYWLGFREILVGLCSGARSAVQPGEISRADA